MVFRATATNSMIHGPAQGENTEQSEAWHVVMNALAAEETNDAEFVNLLAHLPESGIDFSRIGLPKNLQVQKQLIEAGIQQKQGKQGACVRGFDAFVDSCLNCFTQDEEFLRDQQNQDFLRKLRGQLPLGVLTYFAAPTSSSGIQKTEAYPRKTVSDKLRDIVSPCPQEARPSVATVNGKRRLTLVPKDDSSDDGKDNKNSGVKNMPAKPHSAQVPEFWYQNVADAIKNGDQPLIEAFLADAQTNDWFFDPERLLNAHKLIPRNGPENTSPMSKKLKTEAPSSHAATLDKLIEEQEWLDAECTRMQGVMQEFEEIPLAERERIGYSQSQTYLNECTEALFKKQAEIQRALLELDGQRR